MTLPQYAFTCPGRPRPKERPRLGRRGRVYTPTRTLQYERAIRETARATLPRGWDTTGEFMVEIHLYFKPGAVPDVDNCAKGILDGLNTVAYADDRQVIDLHVIRLQDSHERTQVIITRLADAKKRKRTKRTAA